MKYRVLQNFYLNVCSQSQHSIEVIAFEIQHRWRLPDCRPDTLYADDRVIHVESNCCREVDGQLQDVSFPLKLGGKYATFGRGRQAYKFPIRSVGGGYNIYWSALHFPGNRVPHVLNWLRRQPYFSKTEWLTEFEPIWHSRRPLDVRRLQDWGLAQIRRELRRQADETGWTVGKLIHASMPPL